MLEIERLDDGVARITLANEDAANALTDELLAALRQTLVDLDADLTARCVILRGAGGRVFSSGYHTTQLDPARFRERSDPITPASQAMLAGRLPIVGCVNGHAYGGAVDIAASCDLRVGQRDAELVIPAGRFGICYPPAGIARMVATLGRSLTLELLLTGAPVDATRAAAAGFFCQVVAPDEIEEVTLALARAIAGAAPLAIEAMRRFVLELSASAEHLLTERGGELAPLASAALDSADLEEGLRALAERRGPRFQRR